MLSSPPRLPQSRSPASDAQAPRTAALSHFLCAALGARKLFPLPARRRSVAPLPSAALGALLR